MATLHFFGGEKGGVGKSFVTRTVIQYFLDQGIDFALFDADEGNRDVKRIYSSVGCREALFSRDEKEEDEALETYYTASKKPTLVHLPSHVETPFQAWFSENELFELAKEDGVEFTIWFVCSGGNDSLQHLGKTLSFFEDKVNHVLVKNWGVCDDWEALDKDEILQNKIREYSVKVLNFPKLRGSMCRNTIDKKNLTFGAAKESKELRSVNRQRVKTFLKTAYQVFDDSGVFKLAKNLSSSTVLKLANDTHVVKPKQQPKEIESSTKILNPGNGQSIPSEELEELRQYL